MKIANLRIGFILVGASLSGCGVLASNGLDYSTYAIPKIPAAAAPAAAAPSCAMGSGGLAGCKTGDVVVLRGVNFEFDKAALTANAKTLLDDVIKELKSRPDLKVEIAGHTDGMGTDEYNAKLSSERADSVEEYLVAGGIAKELLSARGYGEGAPIASNDTDEGRELNRRVEMKVVESALPAVAAAPAPSKPLAHDAVVVLQPMPSFLTEPGAGIPTSIGVLSHVPEPMEAGPADVISKRALPAGYKGNHPAMKGYPGMGSFGAAPDATPAPATAPEPVAAMPEPAPAPAPAAAPVAASGGNAVSIANFSFQPEELVVTVGTTVTWTNTDNVTHIVDFPDATGKRFAKGASYSKTFDKPGEYTYVCGIHPSMHGKVVVQ